MEKIKSKLEAALENEGEVLKAKKGALSDDELDGVAGGFREDADIPSKGYEIMCPNCKASGVNDIAMEVKVWREGDIQSVEYVCYKCFSPFVVFHGNAYKKQDFIN
ncbi:MAG: hypothetical protein IJU50_07505, partial [Lachnospiraceae bacterium]|nr:hypothetical protein [Lachnospiraceae bacterium]